MKNFFKQTWVAIVAFVMLAVAIVLLALNGFTQQEVVPIIEQIFAILGLLSLLIVAIRQLIQKKDTDKK